MFDDEKKPTGPSSFSAFKPAAWCGLRLSLASLARKLLREQPQINRLECYNDLVALSTMKACDDMGIGIPRQVALIGFDVIFFVTLEPHQRCAGSHRICAQKPS